LSHLNNDDWLTDGFLLELGADMVQTEWAMHKVT